MGVVDKFLDFLYLSEDDYDDDFEIELDDDLDDEFRDFKRDIDMIDVDYVKFRKEYERSEGYKLTEIDVNNSKQLYMCLLELDKRKKIGVGFEAILTNEEKKIIENITELTLKCYLKKIPLSISCFKNLSSLTIYISKSTSLPRNLLNLVKLNSLSLIIIDGELNLPNWIEEFKNLRSLCIDGGRLTEIPRFVEELSELEHLKITHNELKSLPKWIDKLENLKTLDVSGNQLMEMPEAIALLKNLTNLYVNKNQLAFFPECIEKITNLYCLEMKGNKLTTLPDSIAKLKCLKTLDISENRLIELPKDVGELRNLTKLILSKNKLTTLPDSLEQLINLKYLKIESNKLYELPKNIGSLRNLAELDVSRNELTYLPNTIGALGFLVTLEVSYNKIKKIPHTIGLLRKVEFLNLCSNDIKTVPTSLKNLVKLQFFSISYNPITALPDIFYDLKVLDCVELCGLNLDYIPYSLVGFNMLFKIIPKKKGSNSNNIKELKLYNTTIRKQDITMFQNNDQVLIEAWYRDYMSGNTMNVYESKVIFLGDGDVGKTYSIKRLFMDGVRETEETREKYATEMTHGIIIKDMETETEDGDPFKLRIWDFGGQAIMHSMHRCFLTDNTCYVITISTRNSRQMEQARYWLRNVQAFAGDAPVILFVNCWSKMSDSLDIDRLVQEFPKNFQSRNQAICLNAKESSQEEFLKLKDKIFDISRSLSNYGKEIPKSWNLIQNELLRLCYEEQKCIIDQKRYQAICKEYGLLKGMNQEEEEKLQILLLEWFNNIGVCFSYHMNYNKQPLQKYKVLNPEWLTNAIYLLIMQGGSHAHNGVLRHASLQSILKHPEDGESGELPYMQGITYSKEHCEYICDVMRKYQLSYKTEDGEFIPALCSSERPKQLDPEEFDPTNPAHQHIAYVMKYQYLPDTVVQRLMIQLKEYRSATEFWNKGLKITLTDMNLMAVIEMGSGDKKLTIDIYTTGNTKPYEFLPAIREHLTQINEKMNLTPEEMILAHGENGDKEIKLATLLKLKRRNENIYYDQDNDNRFSVSELLDSVFGKDVISDYKNNTEEGSPNKTEDYLAMINASVERILNERSKESESSITQNVIKALTKVQDNNLINKPGTIEDQFNDYVRDTLDMIYVAKDQTRAGQSTYKNSNDGFSGNHSTGKRGAGEIDIAINNDNRKLALYEAQILESVESEAIKKHIDKLIVNYNPSGIQLLYHVVYARKEKGKFASFCSRYQRHLEKFEFPYPVLKPLEEVEDDITAMMRHMKVTLDMEGKPAIVHFIVARVNA